MRRYNARSKYSRDLRAKGALVDAVDGEGASDAGPASAQVVSRCNQSCCVFMLRLQHRCVVMATCKDPRTRFERTRSKRTRATRTEYAMKSWRRYSNGEP